MLPAIETVPLQAFDGTGAGELFLFGRLLFGGILAFTGLNQFMDIDGMTGHAASKGIPAPKLGVVVSGGILVFGGVALALGALPAVAAGGLAVFFLVTTPLMHDFWNAPEEQTQAEMTNFLKNTALLGAALAFLALSAVEWPYAVGLGLL